MRLEGKVALITGAGSGIGRASALRFAAEGARVVVVDWNADGGRETVALIRAQGGQAIFVEADVSQEADVQRMVAATVEAFGRLDILFNNAAVQVFGTIPETSASDWQKVLDVNLKGVFLGCKYALPQMIAQGGGCIVNMSSTLGLVGDPTMPAYGATKGGILAMSKAMAQAHGRQNIRVNCICPGDVDTPIVQEYFDQQPDPAAARRQVSAHYAPGLTVYPGVANYLLVRIDAPPSDGVPLLDGMLQTSCSVPRLTDGDRCGIDAFELSKRPAVVDIRWHRNHRSAVLQRDGCGEQQLRRSVAHDDPFGRHAVSRGDCGNQFGRVRVGIMNDVLELAADNGEERFRRPERIDARAEVEHVLRPSSSPLGRFSHVSAVLVHSPPTTSQGHAANITAGAASAISQAAPNVSPVAPPILEAVHSSSVA